MTALTGAPRRVYGDAAARHGGATHGELRLATQAATLDAHAAPPRRGPHFDAPTPTLMKLLFLVAILGGIGIGVSGFLTDLRGVGEVLAPAAYLTLALALFIALGFEFVNGFHDTANAVATVIYTNSLKPLQAVVWSGLWNFAGVMASAGGVAYSIVKLLPVELILRVGTGAGYAMLFALLLAAIIWNFGTWFFGIPNSSSHALIGSVLGVGVANQLLAPSPAQASGVDWSQATKIFEGLAMAPVIGCVGAGLLLLLAKALLKNPALYREPVGDTPPPPGIRALLIATCTGVSFFHGSNDGQKGIGLLMLILIGVAPTAFAVNRAATLEDGRAFVAASADAASAFDRLSGGAPRLDLAVARTTVNAAVKAKAAEKPEVYAALATMTANMGAEVERAGSIARVPTAETTQLRDDLYLVGSATRILGKAKLADSEAKPVKALDKAVAGATQYIPTWVKAMVALALGLGTMVGWRRIVVTVGEKIGKQHLTYAQGASAELTAMATIFAADTYKLPVSTTHILSSGVAGTMAANGSGLQWGTVRAIALAWVTTLPATILLAGGLYALLRALLA
jgi:PiT family inorganic phosphate transporter